MESYCLLHRCRMYELLGEKERESENTAGFCVTVLTTVLVHDRRESTTFAKEKNSVATMLLRTLLRALFCRLTCPQNVTYMKHDVLQFQLPVFTRAERRELLTAVPCIQCTTTAKNSK